MKVSTKKEIMQRMKEHIKNNDSCGIIVDKNDIEDFNKNYLPELKKDYRIKVIGRTFCIYPKAI